MTRQILAVRRDHDGAITHLSGMKWSSTIDGVLADIAAGRYRYIVSVDERMADVFVAGATPESSNVLRTTSDTTTRAQLDRLPVF